MGSPVAAAIAPTAGVIVVIRTYVYKKLFTNHIGKYFNLCEAHIFKIFFGR